MLFNSFDFGLFLPIVFILYWLISSQRLKQQNILLLCASYIFYGIWDWRFLILIFLSSIVDFYASQKIESSSQTSHKKIWLYLSVFWNLGVLFTFKYFNFFLDNFKALFDISETGFSTLNIIIPVGLSFYTFQTMSYTIDVYRKNLKPTHNLLQFLCFVFYRFFCVLKIQIFRKHSKFKRSNYKIFSNFLKNIWEKFELSRGIQRRDWKKSSSVRVIESRLYIEYWVGGERIFVTSKKFRPFCIVGRKIFRISKIWYLKGIKFRGYT